MATSNAENAVGSMTSAGMTAGSSGSLFTDLIEIAFPLVPQLIPPFTINVNNNKTEYLSVDIPEGKFIFYIGALAGISTEAFFVLNNHVDADIDDNDTTQILEEFVTGNSGGIGDFESVPGLDGFELISLTRGSYSVAIEDGLTFDVLTFQGEAMKALIASLDRPTVLDDGMNQFGIVNLDSESVITGSGEIDTQPEAADLLSDGLDTTNDRVRLVGVEADNFAVIVNETGSQAFDYLVLEGDTVTSAIASVGSGQVDPANAVSEFVIAEGDDDDVVAVGGEVFEGFGVPSLGREITIGELGTLLVTVGKRPNVRVVDQGETIRFEILGEDGSTDLIVFQTDQSPPDDAYDVDFQQAKFADELDVFIDDLKDRPVQTLVNEAQSFLSDALNFTFSIPPLRNLIETIAPEQNVPDVPPLTEKPVIDVTNGVAETATVEIPDGQFVFEIGSPFEVGSEGGFSLFSTKKRLPISELSGILRADVDADATDNDVQQLLEEIVTGQSNAVLDFESTPGIDGVELIGLTPNTYTLEFADGDVEDRLTLMGPGAETILEEFDSRADANLADGRNNLSLVDLASDDVTLGPGPFNPIADIVGPTFDGKSDALLLLFAAETETNSAVSLISEDDTSFSVRIENDVTGEIDLLVFFDTSDPLALI